MVVGLINDMNTTPEAIEEFFGPVERDVFIEYTLDEEAHTFVEVIEEANRREMN